MNIMTIKDVVRNYWNHKLKFEEYYKYEFTYIAQVDASIKIIWIVWWDAWEIYKHYVHSNSEILVKDYENLDEIRVYKDNEMIFEEYIS